MKYVNKFLKTVWCAMKMTRKESIIPKSISFILVFYLVFVSAFFVASFIFPPNKCSNIEVLLHFETIFYGYQYVFIGMLFILCVVSLSFIVRAEIKGVHNDR